MKKLQRKNLRIRCWSYNKRGWYFYHVESRPDSVKKRFIPSYPWNFLQGRDFRNFNQVFREFLRVSK